MGTDGANHGQEKLCGLTCCPCNLDLEKVKALVNQPRYICESCGRVANDRQNLCKPVPLN